MKIPRYVVTTATLLLALTGSRVVASAQQTEPEKEAALVKVARQKAELESQLQAKPYTVLGAKFGFETKLVKGAPYSAVAVTETVQMLGDGNRIAQRSSTMVYRDSAGRTRRETLVKDGQPQAIVISDPATGVNYMLDPNNRRALKHGSPLMMRKLEVGRVEEELKVKLEAEKKRAPLEDPAGTLPRKKVMPTPEVLGRQVVEGVEAEGTRTTSTIPAGQIGNDLPINIVSEQWYSPELQLLVMSKHSDPRMGETTYRLTNINRTEPDRTLFEVPADYTLSSEVEVKRQQAGEKLELEKKMRAKQKPEEQQ
jgi:hypothetical protein